MLTNCMVQFALGDPVTIVLLTIFVLYILNDFLLSISLVLLYALGTKIFYHHEAEQTCRSEQKQESEVVYNKKDAAKEMIDDKEDLDEMANAERKARATAKERAKAEKKARVKEQARTKNQAKSERKTRAKEKARAREQAKAEMKALIKDQAWTKRQIKAGKKARDRKLKPVD